MSQLGELKATHRLVALLVPWAFVVVFAALYWSLLLPRAREGHWLALVVAVLVGLALISFVVAAYTFSRDVLRRRWP